MGEDTRESWRRYLAGEEGFERPRRVTVEVTSRCNLSCPMCPRQHLLEHGLAQGDMDPALFRKIVDEMAGWPSRALVPFFRGEPLMHPGFLEMMAYAAGRGVGPIQLASNAMLLDAETSRGILDLGLDFISFSLDARGKEAYERIRRGADYDRVMSNIAEFLRLREAGGRRLPVVQVSAVRTAENDSLIEAFVEHWQGRVERVRVYPEHSQGGRFGRLEGADHGSPRLPCLKPLTDMVVYWDGQVGLCNHDWRGEADLGDAREMSLERIWRGPAYRLLRGSHAGGVVAEGSACSDCDHWQAYYTAGGIVGDLYE